MDQPLHQLKIARIGMTTPQNEPLDDNDDNGYEEYNIPQIPDEV